MIAGDKRKEVEVDKEIGKDGREKIRSEKQRGWRKNEIRGGRDGERGGGRHKREKEGR